MNQEPITNKCFSHLKVWYKKNMQYGQEFIFESAGLQVWNPSTTDLHEHMKLKCPTHRLEQSHSPIFSDILRRRPTVFLNDEIDEKQLASNEPYFTWLEHSVYSLWKKLV